MVLGITLDGVGMWNFRNGFARNVLIFGADNISSSHTDNKKNNFSVFGKKPTYETNGGINFSEAKTKFCLSLYYKGFESYFL